MIILKDPNDVADYGFTWTQYLSTGETVITSVWTIPDGLVEEAVTEINTGTITGIWLSGGTADVDYKIKNRVITNMGRKKTRSHIIKVREQ